MRSVIGTCSALPQLLQTLANPVVTAPEKQRLILSIEGEGAQKSYEAFARVAVENGRETLIADIARAYMRLYRQLHNISVVTLISTERLPEAVYARIAKEVEARTHGTVEFDIRLDPALGGGFILQIDDLRCDASVRGQLERIKRQLTSRTRNIV